MSTALPIAAVAALALAGTLARRGARNGAPMPSMAKPFAELPVDKRTDVRGAVLYEGPSRIDKEPIIVIMTYTSSNEKTGDIPQVWLLPHGVHPHQARVEGHDTRVCGGCIFAGNRGCYLNWFELKSIQDSYTRGNYSDWGHAAWWMRRNAPSVIRIGAYGDPAAAPLEVWERLAALPSGKPGSSGQASTATLIGYTQLWRSPLARGLERFCMASTKSPTEYADAKRRGWRSFRVALPEDAVCAQAQVRCPATDSDEDTCKGCKLCSGGASGPDVMEPIHGNPRVAGKAMAQMRKLKEREAKGSLARQRGVCGRCDGRGKIGAFAHYAGGVCFACGGTGELEIDPAVKSATSAAKDYREVDLQALGRAFIVRDGAGFTADVDHGKIWFRVVDGRVVVDALSDGLKARRVTTRKVQEALQSVLRVRGSAAFGETGGGGIRYKVWHQTNPAAAQAIRRQGFRIDLPVARKSDNEMPDGVFLKFSHDPIRVGGEGAEQLSVEAEVDNPLRVRDRDQLRSILMQDERYAQLSGEHRLIDQEYKKRVDEAEVESDRVYAQVYAQREALGFTGRVRRIEDPRLDATYIRTDAIIKEWGERIDALAAEMRGVSTQILLRGGYDALFMDEDQGSFGRKARTLVVLDPRKARPVSGSAARRTPAVTQADLDAIRGWWGRGKGAAEDPELQQRIRALGERFDIVPPKVLYRGLSVAPGTIGPQTTNPELARLASGLRSWSKDKRMASAYAKRDLHRNADEVVLIWSQPAKEHLILDAGQLDAAARRTLGVESSMDTSEVIAEPPTLVVESVKKKVLGPNRYRLEVNLTTSH